MITQFEFLQILEDLFTIGRLLKNIFLKCNGFENAKWLHLTFRYCNSTITNNFTLCIFSQIYFSQKKKNCTLFLLDCSHLFSKTIMLFFIIMIIAHNDYVFHNFRITSYLELQWRRVDPLYRHLDTHFACVSITY